MPEVGSPVEHPASNDEYRRLVQEHQEYEIRLSALSEKAVLNEDEEVEERLLKKKKLHIKDRLESLAREARLRH